MHIGRRVSAREATLGALVVVALLTGVAHAGLWRKWAPDPLASDSTYRAMLARPADSLSAAESSWIAVQRDWRAQRDAEAPSSSISVQHRPHPVRPGDERFAALASRPYAALADSERAWLVAENAAQRIARESQGGAKLGTGAKITLWAVAVGAVAALIIAITTPMTSRPL